MCKEERRMIHIRQATPEELPQIKDLWKKCFGDPSAYIDVFYQTFAKPDQTLVVEEAGEINSMAVMLPSTMELPDGNEVSVGYVYALATNPYVQGKGHARQLLAYADQYLQERGCKAMILVPASPSLHRFFDALGMDECFATRKVEILTSNLTGKMDGASMEVITPSEYNAIRESYLKGTFHMTYTDHMIHFQQIGSHLAGGDLYKIEVDGQVGCAAIEYVQQRRLLVKELLLSPDKMTKAVEVIASQMDASRYHVRTPAFWDGLPGSYPQSFGMIKWYDEALHKQFSHKEGYLGLAFD